MLLGLEPGDEVIVPSFAFIIDKSTCLFCEAHGRFLRMSGRTR